MGVKVTNLEETPPVALNPRGAETQESSLPPDEGLITELARNAVEAYVMTGCVVEPAKFEDLNPAGFGVVVTDQSGSRRGLLLPDIESIETAGQQVGVAARKAGIKPGEPLRLYRFRTHRFSESAWTSITK